MKRILLAVLLATAAIRADAVDYTDIWYNPAQPGYGYNLVQSDSFIFVTFFIYGPSGAPTWYTAETTWNGVDSYTGDVYANTGTFFAVPWVPANLTNVKVGTAAFKPSAANNYQGTLSYTVTGVGSASQSLERQSLTTIATAGNYIGAQAGEYTGCATATNNFAYTDPYTLTVTEVAGGNTTFAFAYRSGFACEIVGKYAQHGQYYVIASATYACDDGVTKTSGAAKVTDIKRTALGLEGRYTATGLPDGCFESATFGGPKLP